jgi:hypothetical protein
MAETKDIVHQHKWGICGFVCVLNALNQRGGFKMWGKDVAGLKLDAHIGPEIIGYLKQTEADNPKLAAEIVKFTGSFGAPYNTYNTITKLCDEIAKHVRANTVDAKQGFGVALPLEAIKDYVTTHCNLKCTTWTKTEALTPKALEAYKDQIVGVGKGKLQHWVYVDKGGVLMNWNEDYKLSDKVEGAEGVKALTDQDLTQIICGVKLA